MKDIHKLSTLFPTDLLPLITMVIKALEPPHNYTEVLLKADSDTTIPSITQSEYVLYVLVYFIVQLYCALKK